MTTAEQIIEAMRALDAQNVPRPNYMVVPAGFFRVFRYRPPIKKARSVRGRKRAIMSRRMPLIYLGTAARTGEIGSFEGVRIHVS